MMNELSLLDELLSGDCGFLSSMTAAGTPDVDVLQTKNAYTINMDLPGKTENEVSISLKDNVLTISSVKAEVKAEVKADNNAGNAGNTDKADPQGSTEAAEDKPVYIIRERSRGSFTRSFKLPRDIDAGSVRAAFANGVLTITVPRKPEEEARRILINVA